MCHILYEFVLKTYQMTPPIFTRTKTHDNNVYICIALNPYSSKRFALECIAVYLRCFIIINSVIDK